MSLKEVIKRIPLLAELARTIYWRSPAGVRRSRGFAGSAAFWEKHYSSGGDSGHGSYGLLAEFKAEVINEFVIARGIKSVIEFGCGDGHQLSLARYPEYLGLDVSGAAVSRCRQLFESDTSKAFKLLTDYRGEKADLALSLDVIFHLVEDGIYERYMEMLFGASTRFVVIYSSNLEGIHGYDGLHVRHRKFTAWVERHRGDWRLIDRRSNRYPYRDANHGSHADFYIYGRSS